MLILNNRILENCDFSHKDLVHIACKRMSRLSRCQLDRLDGIMEYTTSARPELEWMGHKRESKHLSKEQWRMILSSFLYRMYNDMYEDSISREAIDDFFDDEYVTNLLSMKALIYSFVRQCWPAKECTERKPLIQKK